jgi:hypothetical protein
MTYSKVDFGDKQTQWAGGAGKGDAERPVDRKKYRENWDAIFGKKNKKQAKKCIDSHSKE